MTDNNGMGYNMNLVPQGYGNGGYDGGMFGGNWMWFLLVWMAMFGWGNGGFGFGGGNGGGYVGNEVQRGFDQQAIMTGIAGVQGTVNGIVPAMQNGFAQAEIAANARQMADMNQNFAIQNALQQCCCENRAATADLKYTVANEGAATRLAEANNTQKIMDELCQIKFDNMKQNYEGQLRTLQSQINGLTAENQNLKFLSSQGAQTAQILANNEAQTAALEQYLAPVPRPAYMVQNPNCCQNQFGYGGCGCTA